MPRFVDDVGYVAEVQFWVALVRRDYQGELDRLQAETRGAIDNQDTYAPIPLWRAQVLGLVGSADLARRSFDAAREELERKVRADSGDHRFRSSLGVAYAGLGRRDDAVREARLGCELMPASKDALRAIQRLQDLALVYTMVGRHDEAIAALDDLLARSGWYTVHVLRLDPRWDPLRTHPRYQALLRKHEVKS
jgi:serine/threonine-protein kinase